jgi:hypothetical protein
MKTLSKILFMMVFTVGVTGTPELPAALAAPGDGAEQPRLQVLDAGPPPGQSVCARGERLCFAPAGPSTTWAPSSATAVAGRAAGVDTSPSFARAAAGGGRAAASLGDDVPWTIDLVGELRHAALAGNALFIVYDARDEKALADNEVTALWQARIRAGASVAARLTLVPEDGFRSGHTYRVRIAQLVGGKQIVLGEGSLHLQ